MKYQICDYIPKPLKNGEFCNKECERPWCSGCFNSRRVEIDGSVFYYCEVSGAFKTLTDRCNLQKEIKTKC